MNMIDNNNLCEFLDIGWDQYQCERCGTIILSHDGPPAMICSAFNKEDIQKLEAKDQACSVEEVERRYSICIGCEFFAENSCKQCGCRIVRNQEFKNKLFWKNQSCPINKW